MDRLRADAIGKIEQIHSRWIEFEIAGEDHRLIELCASDIELWPPDAPSVRGRSAVSEYMAQGTPKIQRIEIAERRVRGSNEVAYLTANYETTFSTMATLGGVPLSAECRNSRDRLRAGRYDVARNGDTARQNACATATRERPRSYDLSGHAGR